MGAEPLFCPRRNLSKIKNSKTAALHNNLKLYQNIDIGTIYFKRLVLSGKSLKFRKSDIENNHRKYKSKPRQHRIDEHTTYAANESNISYNGKKFAKTR